MPEEASGSAIPAFPKGFPQPAIRALAAEGYERLDQLAGSSERHLLALHGVGPTAIRLIRQGLEAAGHAPLAD